METLQEALESYKKGIPRKTREAEILDGIQRLKSHLPYDCEQKSWSAAATHLIGEYFRMQFVKTFPGLSQEILALEQTLDVDGWADSRTQRTYDLSVRIPMFAFAEFGAKNWSWKGKAQVEYVEYGSQRKGSLEVELTAPTPPLTDAVKEKAAESLAFVYESYGKALRASALHDFLVHNQFGSLGLKYLDPTTASLHVLWRPSPEQFQIKNVEKDPALLLKYRDELYLVTTWDVAGEQPFQHVLKEYAGVELEE